MKISCRPATQVVAGYVYSSSLHEYTHKACTCLQHVILSHTRDVFFHNLFACCVLQRLVNKHPSHDCKPLTMSLTKACVPSPACSVTLLSPWDVGMQPRMTAVRPPNLKPTCVSIICVLVHSTTQQGQLCPPNANLDGRSRAQQATHMRHLP